MQYFKNADLTKMYPVSEKAIRNWITAAKEGKLELSLHEKGGRMYVANTSRNAATIDRLVNDRKKYVNSRSRKTVRPIGKFYEIYNKEQIFDIITNLETYGEIPLKYSYFNSGAQYWDQYSQKLADESLPNLLNRTVDLLELNTDYLSSLLEGYTKINVIDIGPGNGLPVKKYLERLIREGKLGRYIALDVSQAMLDIVESNMNTWFGRDFPFEGYVKDIAHDRYKDILGEDAIGSEAESVCNLTLVLGSLMANFRSPEDGWRVIHNSIGPNDFLLYTLKLDSEAAKRYFDFSVDKDVQSLSPRHKLMLDYLNIDQSMYDVEQFFDDSNKRRVIQVRLKTAIDVDFSFEGVQHKVQFDKNDVLIIFQYWHQSTADILGQLKDSGFSLLQASQSRDHEYLLTISEVKGK